LTISQLAFYGKDCIRLDGSAHKSSVHADECLGVDSLQAQTPFPFDCASPLVQAIAIMSDQQSKGTDEYVTSIAHIN